MVFDKLNANMCYNPTLSSINKTQQHNVDIPIESKNLKERL